MSSVPQHFAITNINRFMGRLKFRREKSPKIIFLKTASFFGVYINFVNGLSLTFGLSKSNNEWKDLF